MLPIGRQRKFIETLTEGLWQVKRQVIKKKAAKGKVKREAKKTWHEMLLEFRERLESKNT